MSALGPAFPTTREDAAEGRINGILGTYYRAVEDVRAWTPGGSKFVCDVSEVDTWEPHTSTVFPRPDAHLIARVINNHQWDHTTAKGIFCSCGDEVQATGMELHRAQKIADALAPKPFPTDAEAISQWFIDSAVRAARLTPDREPATPDLVETVQWNGFPAPVVALLADEDGKTYGYGYGHGASMVFSFANGNVSVNTGQWVALWTDGTVTVHDTEPLG